MHSDETDAWPDLKSGIKVNPVTEMASSIGVLGASGGVDIKNLGLKAGPLGGALAAGTSFRVGGFPASPSAMGSLWSQKSPFLSASIGNMGAANAGHLAAASSLPLLSAIKVNPVTEMASSIGVLGASGGVDIKNLGLKAGPLGGALAAGTSFRVGGFPASPSAMGSLWSQKSPFPSASIGNMGAANAGLMSFPAVGLPAEREEERPEDPELSEVAVSTWDFAERLGTWAQSLPNRDTRNVFLNCGAVLISLAGAVVAMSTGGAIVAVAGAWAIFYMLSLISSLIDKLQD